MTIELAITKLLTLSRFNQEVRSGSGPICSYNCLIKYKYMMNSRLKENVEETLKVLLDELCIAKLEIDY